MNVADNRLEAAMAYAGMRPSSDIHMHTRAIKPWNRAQVDPDRPPKIPDPLPPTWAAGPGALLVLDLEPGLCKFPVGDASGVDQLHCGNPTHLHRDEPYCPTCATRILPRGAPINPKVLH